MKTTNTATASGDSTGTTYDSRSQEAPHIVDGEPWTEWKPDVQNAGVDTIEFSFDVAISDTMWNRLEAEQQIAKMLQQTRKAIHVPDWLNAEIHATGAKGGYHFLLETPTFAVKLLRGVPHRPPIYVEIRAFGLHTHQEGPIGACEAACAFIRETLLTDQDPGWTAQAISLDTARCSRLDLFLDWQGGWHPAFSAGDERHFVKRVHAEVSRRSANGHVTGYEVGKGVVRARIYNKTDQSKKQHIEWYHKLLQGRNGTEFNPAIDLWRLEFQLRRDGIRGFRFYAKPEMSDPDEMIDAEIEAEDLPHIHSVRKALHWSGHLWTYLTTCWLRLVVPTEDPNRGRWPEHPTWVALRTSFTPIGQQGASQTDQQLEMVRAARYSGYRRLLDRMVLGMLTTLEAMDTDPGAALVAYVAYLARIAGRIKRQQKRRAGTWRRIERNAAKSNVTTRIATEIHCGLGARVDSPSREEKREQLLHMALGTFTSAGVVHLRIQHEADLDSVGDLILYSLDELDGIAVKKGGIRQLLEEKWCKVYKARNSRGLFTNTSPKPGQAA